MNVSKISVLNSSGALNSGFHPWWVVLPLPPSPFIHKKRSLESYVLWIPFDFCKALAAKDLKVSSCTF